MPPTCCRSDVMTDTRSEKRCGPLFIGLGATGRRLGRNPRPLAGGAAPDRRPAAGPAPHRIPGAAADRPQRDVLYGTRTDGRGADADRPDSQPPSRTRSGNRRQAASENCSGTDLELESQNLPAVLAALTRRNWMASKPWSSRTLVGIAALAALTCRFAAAATLYVAPDGDDRWSGALRQANADKTDGPLKTLTGRATPSAS